MNPPALCWPCLHKGFRACCVEGLLNVAAASHARSSFKKIYASGAASRGQHFHAGFESAGALDAMDVYRHMPVPKRRNCQSGG
jgi:hypothetical protein